MARIALITGITGQDGAYLAQLLLDKGYEIHGIIRQSSVSNTSRLQLLLKERFPQIQLHYGDLTDSFSLLRIIQETRPDEIYNLAAQSHVKVSFDIPEYTSNTNALGAMRLLEAIRHSGLAETARFYQASTSEIFGDVQESPQKETTMFCPRSPYGIAKLHAYWTVKNYREAYGIHASNGILFNHESPLRGENFVSQKIIKAIVSIEKGSQGKLTLGNLDAKRDWGHAKDYVDGMWRMLQQETPDDYVLATGQTRTVRDFVEKAFGYFGRSIEWQGIGLNEKGFDASTGNLLIDVDKEYFRLTEVDALLGDASKARNVLKWQPCITFESLVKEMTEFELNHGEL